MDSFDACRFFDVNTHTTPKSTIIKMAKGYIYGVQWLIEYKLQRGGILGLGHFQTSEIGKNDHFVPL